MTPETLIRYLDLLIAIDGRSPLLEPAAFSERFCWTITDIVSICDEGIAKLTPREKEVICYRFGLHGQELLTIKRTSELISALDDPNKHISIERVRQIEAKALRKLRHPTRNIVQRLLETHLVERKPQSE